MPDQKPLTAKRNCDDHSALAAPTLLDHGLIFESLVVLLNHLLYLAMKLLR
jgi:hypothetical protein